MKGQFTFLAAGVLALILTAPAGADIIRATDTDVSGSGLGAVFTVLTIQAPPERDWETGCVFWDGSGDVTGSAGCPVGAGLLGGDEKAITNTWSLQELGLSNFAYLRITFEAIESGGDVQIDQLHLLILSSGGGLLYAPALVSPEYFAETVPGTGQGLYKFKLDPTQAALANNYLAADNRLGLAAEVSLASAGHETFFFTQKIIPEPMSLVLIGAGLLALGLARGLRRKAS